MSIDERWCLYKFQQSTAHNSGMATKYFDIKYEQTMEIKRWPQGTGSHEKHF